MDKEIFVQNVKRQCTMQQVKPTVACRESGAGVNLISQLEKRGTIPSIERVQMLAQYLGVTTSELLGEPLPQYGGDPDVTQLAIVLAQLNAEGREKLLDYADDLVASQKYIKTGSVTPGQELA